MIIGAFSTHYYVTPINICMVTKGGGDAAITTGPTVSRLANMKVVHVLVDMRTAVGTRAAMAMHK